MSLKFKLKCFLLLFVIVSINVVGKNTIKNKIPNVQKMESNFLKWEV